MGFFSLFFSIRPLDLFICFRKKKIIMKSWRNIFLLLSLALTGVCSVVTMSLAAANRAGSESKDTDSHQAGIVTDNFAAGMGITGAIMVLMSSMYGCIGLIAFNDIHLPSYTITGAVGSWFLAANSGVYLYTYFLNDNTLGSWSLAEAELAFSIISSAFMMISVAIAIGARAKNDYERLHGDGAGGLLEHGRGGHGGYHGDGGEQGYHHDGGGEGARLNAAPLSERVPAPMMRLTILSLSSIVGVLSAVLLGVAAANYSGATDANWPFNGSGFTTPIDHTPSVLAGLTISGAAVGIFVALATVAANVMRLADMYPALKPMWADGAFLCTWLLAAGAGIYAAQLYAENQSAYPLQSFSISGQTMLMVEFGAAVVTSVAWALGVTLMAF
jgi:hypothetical protein